MLEQRGHFHNRKRVSRNLEVLPGTVPKSCESGVLVSYPQTRQLMKVGNCSIDRLSSVVIAMSIYVLIFTKHLARCAGTGSNRALLPYVVMRQGHQYGISNKTKHSNFTSSQYQEGGGRSSVASDQQVTVLIGIASPLFLIAMESLARNL